MKLARVIRERDVLLRVVGELFIENKINKKSRKIAMKIAPNKNSKNNKNEQGKKVNKTKLAKNLGMCLQSLYYKPKLPDKDLILKNKLRKCWHNTKLMITRE